MGLVVSGFVVLLGLLASGLVVVLGSDVSGLVVLLGLLASGLVVVIGLDVSGLVVVAGLLIVELETSVLSEPPILSAVELEASVLCSVELVLVTSVWFWVVELTVSLSTVVSLPSQADIDKTIIITSNKLIIFLIFIPPFVYNTTMSNIKIP